MKQKLIILFIAIFIAFSLLRCAKVYVRTNHEKPYCCILEDLKISLYDSSKTEIELRLWVHGEFGLIKLYRYYLSKDSIWNAEKYTPYRFGKRGPIFVTKSFYERNKNKLLWTKKKKVLNSKWNLKWERLLDLSIYKLSGVDNYSHNSYEDINGEKTVIIVCGGNRFEIEIFNNRFYKNYDYSNPDIYIEYNKDNAELKKFIEIIKIITDEI